MGGFQPPPGRSIQGMQDSKPGWADDAKRTALNNFEPRMATAPNMNHPSPNALFSCLALLVRHPFRWLAPAAVITAVGVGYALLRAPTWEATQALRIRPATSINEDSLAELVDSEQMKATQETMLEVLKSRSVLEAAMRRIGPPAKRRSEKPWPTGRELSDFRGQVQLSPPGGLEFGASDIFYLTVRSSDRDRAIALCRSVGEELVARVKAMRKEKSENLCVELTEVVELARADLDRSAARLAEIEERVGSDLGELRSLSETNASDTALQRTAVEIRNELRQARTTERTNRRLLDLLKAAQQDPGRLLAAPAALLESQPALRRLKDGLVDAQLETARMKGSMSDAHPLVVASVAAENEISQHLHDEIGVALRALKSDVEAQAERIAMLEERESAAGSRLAELARLRADYGHWSEETRHRTTLLQRAEQQLAEARAMKAGAASSSLVWALDAPETGPDPVGPGRTTIALGGLLGGGLVGIGILLLTTSPDSVDTPLVPLGANAHVSHSPGHYASAAVFAFAPGTTWANGHGANGHAVNGHGANGHLGGGSLKTALLKIAGRRAQWNG